MTHISTFTYLNIILPVVSTSGSVRTRKNSIREIHGPVWRPLSEIDGVRSRSRKGGSSPDSVFCRCPVATPVEGVWLGLWKGKEGRPEAMLHPGPRGLGSTTIISFSISHEWKFLQLAVGWLMAVVNQCWECCMGFYSWGKWCGLHTTCTALPNPPVLFPPLLVKVFSCVFEINMWSKTKKANYAYNM